MGVDEMGVGEMGVDEMGIPLGLMSSTYLATKRLREIK